MNVAPYYFILHMMNFSTSVRTMFAGCVDLLAVIDQFCFCHCVLSTEHMWAVKLVVTIDLSVFCAAFNLLFV